MNIRFPNITGKSEAEQLREMKSYLHQLVQDLNYALANVENSGSTLPSTVNGLNNKKKDTASNFNDIKGLIINSADIVNAYYQEINGRMSKVYVAESDFGTYTETWDASFDRLSSEVSNFKQIETDNMDAIQGSISQLLQTANDLTVRVTRIDGGGENGAISVTTMAGTFDDQGLHIAKEGQPVSSLLDNEGLHVQSGDTVVLEATDDGVEAVDIKVHNYLVVGKHARFEDYTDGTDSKRTACFWVDREE